MDFYGPIHDSINAADASDRLLMAWPTDDSRTRPTAPEKALRQLVRTPDDIVALRRSDPPEALEWRHRVREELGGLLARGGVVTGFTRDGAYAVEVAD